MTHPTLKIIGFMLVKRAFLIVALFRHGVARGRSKRDPRVPKAPQREPQGAPRLPKVHQWRAFGAEPPLTPKRDRRESETNKKHGKLAIQGAENGT